MNIAIAMIVPLEVAVSMVTDEKLVQLLLENGADPNALSEICGNVLNAAVSKSNLNIVRLLLNEGADVNVFDEVYGTAMNVAFFKYKPEIIKLLEERGAGPNNTPIISSETAFS